MYRNRLIVIPLLVLFSIMTAIQFASGDQIRITKIIDGDTIKIGSEENVRLLQIDTPELRGSECYAQEARVALANILKENGTLRMTTDPKLDQLDSRKRLLRYVFVGKVNVNLRMVQVGAASPYFFRKELGMYSKQLLAAAKIAKSQNLGLWKACPGTKLDPYSALTTVYPPSHKDPKKEVGKNCDPNYAGCVPTYPPDLDCAEIKQLGLAPVRVIGRDVHGLDRDGDGIGCD